MITMDVHGHMAALREAAPLEAHEQLDPNRHFTHFSKGHHPWPQHADAPLEAPAGYPVQGTGAQLADVQVCTCTDAHDADWVSLRVSSCMVSYMNLFSQVILR